MLSNNATSKRLPGLDGLRAIAVMLVILHHVDMRCFLDLPGPLQELVREGKFGVSIFFVLSGFLITYLLCGEERAAGGISLRAFYVRRAFRILPAAFLYLAVVGVLAFIGYVALPASDLAYSALFVRNLAYRYYGPPITGHYWSLAIEEQFYLVWPLLFLFIRGRERLRLAAALVILAPLWRTLAARMGIGLVAYPTRTDLLYDGLAIGCTLALLRADAACATFMRGKVMTSNWLIFALAPLFTIAAFHPSVIPESLAPALPTIACLCVAVFINYLLERSDNLICRIFETSPLVWLGRMSYSLYLWQQLFILREETFSAATPLNVVRDLGLTLLCAAASYYLIEQPALRLRQRLMRGAPAVTPLCSKAPA